jgi:hypothetical protein
MPTRLDPIVGTGIVAFGLLFFLAGIGWAYWGTDIFLTAIMAGLSYCGSDRPATSRSPPRLFVRAHNAPNGPGARSAHRSLHRTT